MWIKKIKSYQKFLSNNKLYTLVSVLGFAISLMFVILLGVYVKQELSVDDFQEKKERIYLMTHDNSASFGNPMAQFIKDKCPEVESYVRMMSYVAVVSGKDKDKSTGRALFADSTFFNIFSFKLVEGEPSKVLELHNSLVITQSYANTMFAEQNPIGKSIFINDREYNITGIMEDIPQNTMIPQSDFIINYNSIIYTHWGGGDWVLTSDGNFGFTMFFLEREGANLPSKTEMLLGLFKEDFWYYKEGFTSDLKFIPIKEAYFTLENSGYCDLKRNDKTQITVYAGIGLLILIIAILNYINMTVAQAGFRGKETAIKKLLGSSRKNIISQLLTESLAMTGIAFLIGLFLAFLCEPFCNDMLSTKLYLASQFTVINTVSLLVFIIFIALIAGIIPALVISRFSPLEVVKGALNRKVKSKYSKILIVFQYTVAITLLVCSFLIREQSNFLINHDMGYSRDRIMVMDNVLDVAQMEGFKSKLFSIPGVDLVSFSNGVPSNGGNNMSYELNGQQLSFQEFFVDSVFFKIFNITITPTGVVSGEDTYWMNKKGYDATNVDPKAFICDFGHGNKQAVAGIINDFNVRPLHAPSGLIRMKMLPKDWRPWNITVKIKEEADLYATARRIEKEYSDYNGGELTKAEFVDDVIQEWYTKEKKTTTIISSFTLLTIIITIMGVFAMSLYLVRQKEKEIGLRKVNGATEGEILMMLNLDSFKRVLIAFVIACPIAYYAVNRWLESFAYKISISLWVFVLAGVIVLLLNIVSVSWMTWRAAKANPVDSLKGE